MPTNIETVRASYEAFHRRDLPGVLAALADDVAWTHPDGMNVLGLGGTKRGHDEVVAFIRHVPTHYAEIRLSPEEFIESGDRIVVFGSRRVTGVSGASAVLRFVHSWTFSGGKAATFEDYFDTVEMIRLVTGDG
ncbi:nuclear transport factor 2 family protein [Methylocapsa aurea]|uniref:nuclear transport factor 2 family protein n=1 Tax=Methylocapsa aurea TaxID=663610 RepID=UPI000569E3F7|nr:nuclear transport factor 2 family protein [Methylocapsa aurea]